MGEENTGRAEEDPNDQLKTKTRGVVKLRIQWVPGHRDFAPNERADILAKEAVKGRSSPPKDLPA